MLNVTTSGEVIPRRAWVSWLDDFARRNAGRIAMLDEVDPALGTAGEERGYLVFGTSYHVHGHEVRIVLGESHGRSTHLTRTISNATSIAVLRNATGADLSLRVEHGVGQTVLTFASPPHATSLP